MRDHSVLSGEVSWWGILDVSLHLHQKWFEELASW